LKLNGNRAIATITLQPDEERTIIVKIDGTNLPAGTYSTELMATFTFTNPALDIDSTTTPVPITLTVP